MSDDEIVSTLAELNPLRYRGYYYDNETGMYYLQSRYYNPEWGRFISADDFNYIDSKPSIKLNAYAYCGNNPIKYVDPTGHDFTWDSILDIIMLLMVYDDISINMIEIFGYDFADSFFTLLNLTGAIIPFTHRIILDVIKNVPTIVWDAMEENFEGNVSPENLFLYFSSAFTNSILNYATEATFLDLFAVWGIGFLPAELAVLIPGIILDDSLTPSEKITLIFVDGFSIIISNAISIASNAFDFTGVAKVVASIVSVILPIVTDITAKIIIKKD